MTGAVSFATQTAGGNTAHVAIDNGDTTLDFDASTIAGNLTATSGGEITQSGALTVAGTSSFTTDADDQAITLSDTGNALTGAVDLNTLGTGNATVVNSISVDLAASNVGGKLDVTVSTGDLTINGTVSAGGGYDMTASLGDVIFAANGKVTGAAISSIEATNGSIANTGSEEAITIETTGAGSNLTFTADNSLTKSTEPLTVVSGGDLILNAPIDNTSTTTNLSSADNLDINRNIKDAASILAHSGTDGTGDVAFGTGVTLDAPTVTLLAGDKEGPGTTALVDLLNNTPTVVANSLTVRQDGQMGTEDDPMTVLNEDDPWNPNVTNNSTIDLMLQSDESSIYTTTADSWQSITATAQSGITLEGSSHITTKALTTTTGNISVHSTAGNLILIGAVNADPVSGDSLGGGVELIADTGKIYTPGGDTLNVAITGYSDDTGANNTGVTLPAGTGKAAIVIRTEKDLKLGSTAALTANGSYDDSVASGVDDRKSVNFVLDGDPIDIAIYLASYDFTSLTGNNIDVGSTVTINNSPGVGTLVIDAHDTVTFTKYFEDSLKSAAQNNVRRIEAVSRISETLDMAIELETLPHADGPDNLADGLFSTYGTYVLRGPAVLAKILGLSKIVPLSLPKPLDPQDQGQVEIEIENVQELGLGDKPELAEAYPPSLDTDLNLDKAAQKLYGLLPILRDSSRITALNSIVVDTWQNVNQPLTQEQEAVIAQRIGASTAGPWVAALTDYADILMNMVGRPEAESVLWIMQTYVIPQSQQGLIQDQTVAFIEAQISGIGG